jgi:hypothetical protein
MVEQELLDRCEFTIEYQKQEIDRLRAENQRLIDWIMGSADAHTTLQSIYLDPSATQTNRIKAASAALPVEKPKLMSVVPPMEMDRREAWRIYQRWQLKNEIVLETRHPPPPGWDTHLTGPDYQPPEGTHMPPRTVVLDPTTGFRVLSNLLPKPAKGNGGRD